MALVYLSYIEHLDAVFLLFFNILFLSVFIVIIIVSNSNSGKIIIVKVDLLD